jgi:transposase-like protein
MSNLSSPHFHDEQAAYGFVEARLWPNGPVCPHCGGFDRIGKMGGKSTRIGTYKCYQCRKPFTVKVGTVFESSHVPMRVWLQAMYLMSGSKKGISSNQLHRILGVTLKTAWFMSHRIREAMRSGDLAPFGSNGGVVEADETFIGRDPDKPKKDGARAYHHKIKDAALDLRSGYHLMRQGEMAEAESLFRRAYASFIALGAERESAAAADHVADVLQARGDFEEALRIRREEVLPIYHRFGDSRSSAVADRRRARGPRQFRRGTAHPPRGDAAGLPAPR